MRTEKEIKEQIAHFKELQNGSEYYRQQAYASQICALRWVLEDTFYFENNMPKINLNEAKE